METIYLFIPDNERTVSNFDFSTHQESADLITFAVYQNKNMPTVR